MTNAGGDTVVGFNPDKDYLLDPQQKPDSGFRCGGCGRQIYFGEVYYEMFVMESDITICSDCYKALGRSRGTVGEEIYV